ncbi:LysR family transcriptional regulator [Leeia sp.]|uniref:LysR family transcriptional regulator n=1 Tax=Leeia sp. TaxID=2884678 RepID=UPI0035B10CE9
MSDIKLNQLAVLVAVAEQGSFSQAAVELGCTQSRISHALAELERAVGCRLLQRSRRGSSLTIAGQQVCQQARHILQLVDNIVPSLQQPDGVTGRISIASFRSIATHVLPTVLTYLARTHPALEVELLDGCKDSHEVNDAVCSGKATLGISSFQLPDTLFQAPFLHDEFMLVYPASLNATQAQPLMQTGQLPYIEAGNAARQVVLTHMQQQGWPLQPARTLNSDGSILALVSQGLGFSILPQLALYPLPEGVRQHPLPRPLFRPLQLILQHPSWHLPTLQAVVRTLRNRSLLGRLAVFRNHILHFRD